MNIHDGKELEDHFHLCHRMTLDSYTNLHAAEIVKTVIVKTLAEKVIALGETAATKKRKMMLGNADPISNPKMPKLEATVSNAVKEAAESRIEAVIEEVIVQSMGPTEEAMNIQQQQQPPQQSNNVGADPNPTPVIESENQKSVDGQRRASAYTLWLKSKERKSRTALSAEWKALPKAEKEILQREAKRVNNMNGHTQVATSVNAYNLWAKQQRTKVAQDNPGEDHKELYKRLGAQWRALSEADKKPYIEVAKMSAEGKNGNNSSKEDPARKESFDGKPKENFVFKFKKPLLPTTPPACSSTSKQGPSQQNRVESSHKTVQPEPPEKDRYSGADSCLPTSSSVPKLVFRRNDSPTKSWGISAVNSKADGQQGPERHGPRHLKDAEPPLMNRDDDPKASTRG